MKTEVGCFRICGTSEDFWIDFFSVAVSAAHVVEADGDIWWCSAFQEYWRHDASHLSLPRIIILRSDMGNSVRSKPGHKI